MERPGSRNDDSPSLDRDFEDLTLAELLGQILRAPRATIRAVLDISSTSHQSRVSRRGLQLDFRLAPI